MLDIWRKAGIKCCNDKNQDKDCNSNRLIYNDRHYINIHIQYI